MPSAPDSPSTFPRLVGRTVERVEDAALLTGRGRFAHDVGERPGTAHAAVLRSPHAHAEIVSLDAAAALSMPEVVTVLTGAEVAAWSRPFIAGVKQPMRHYALAVDWVRYTGEPVAVVVARDRYGAEDALERIEVEYRELDPVVDAVAAAVPGAPLLHRDVGSNVVSDRRLRYGDPDAAFASAAHRVAISVRYPRNACTPIEGFVVVAEHLGDDGYDVLSNFQGPFTLHPVMARALGVPGARFRLRSPKDSGGSFGVKQAVFPYVVAMCLASRKARCPVKWVERAWLASYGALLRDRRHGPVRRRSTGVMMPTRTLCCPRTKLVSGGMQPNSVSGQTCCVEDGGLSGTHRSSVSSCTRPSTSIRHFATSQSAVTNRQSSPSRQGSTE